MKAEHYPGRAICLTGAVFSRFFSLFWAWGSFVFVLSFPHNYRKSCPVYSQEQHAV